MKENMKHFEKIYYKRAKCFYFCPNSIKIEN